MALNCLTLQYFSGLKKLSIIFTFPILFCCVAFSQQAQFSLATDVSILRSFKKDQQYWSIGQTVNFHFHFTPTDGAYAWISYFSDGKFTNALKADAKSSATSPQQVNYQNKAQVRFKHISLGWKRYLKGRSDVEKKWNLYGYAGFGLMMGRIINTHSLTIDTSVYIIPVLSGKANFKRLTLDLGLGIEFPVGGDVYIYVEGRALVPTTDYPSQYLFINKNAPFTGAANAGLRILFN
jgi:hypothetical protein